MASQERQLVRRNARVSPDHLSGVASGVALKVDRTTAGDGPSHIRQLQAPGQWGFDLLDLNASVVASGGFDPRAVAVLLIARAAGSVICGVPLVDGMILMLPPGTEVTASVRQGAMWAGAVVPATIWEQAQLTATGIVDDSRRQEPRTFRSRLPDGAATEQALETLAGRMFPAPDAAPETAPDQGGTGDEGGLPRALTDFLGTLAEDCAAGRIDAIERSTGRRLRQAWQARDYIHANLAEDLSVERLCQEVGASRRQLEYAFRTMFDLSPHQFVQQTRLNEARRRLMAGRRRGATVTQVALECGVQHLGRFAHAYAAFFGESPRQTLAAAGASVACGPALPARHVPSTWSVW